MWDILKKCSDTNVTQKQVYTLWSELHKGDWKLDIDQTTSALKVLEAYNGVEMETISMNHEAGIETITFAFKDILESYGKEIFEGAMDSTMLSASAQH
jgi:hypothetical protein